MGRGLNDWGVILRDAAIVLALASGAALLFNGVRAGNAIELVAQQPYQILVPCPEQQGQAEEISAVAARAKPQGVFFIDAREQEAFTAWHYPGAASIPFDYLEAISEAQVRQVLQSGVQKIIIYGDGENPDSGQQLALALSGQGVKNVFYVRGGAPALKERDP